MSKSKSLGVALFAALVFSVCAGAFAAPPAGETMYVASVEVVQQDADAPAGYADALREAVLKEATFYGNEGQPITLRIEIDRVHFKNAAAALIIGDDNQTRGHVFVVDQASGQQLGTFTVRANAETNADIAADIGLTVVGALDPTGVVGMAHMAGDAASADINRAGTTAAMIANFAVETLSETFGKPRARAARRAKRNE